MAVANTVGFDREGRSGKDWFMVQRGKGRNK